MREIQFRQHALSTTQRTAGTPMVQAGSVHAPVGPAGGYPAPPSTEMIGIPTGNQQLMRLPSGQIVMVSPVPSGYENLQPPEQKFIN